MCIRDRVSGGGYGLVGLRERVTALGGHLDAGPDGSGGFRLSARLPASERVPLPVPEPGPVPEPVPAPVPEPALVRTDRPPPRPKDAT